MNRAEANKILERQIEELKTWPYATFAQWQERKHFKVFEIKSETGNYYQIEAQAILVEDKNTGRNIRVIASIDDSHLRSPQAMAPLIKSFIIASNNQIIAD